MDQNNLWAERGRIIGERKAAIYSLKDKSMKEMIWIQSEFVTPLNQQLVQINRILGV